MFQKLFFKAVRVICCFILEIESNTSSEVTNCPDVVKRFTDAILRTTTKSLKIFSDSSPDETGSIAPIAFSFFIATLVDFARAETWEEICKELNLRSSQEVKCATSVLNNEARNLSDCIMLRAPACVFGNSRHRFTPAYMNNVCEITLAGLARDFDFSKSVQCGDAINEIIAERTSCRIPRVLNDYSMFNSSTELVAISALYLTGGWEIEFQRTNKVTEFRISPTESETQTFMNRDAVYNYAHSELLGAKLGVVQVKMCDPSLEVWILLPDCPFTESVLIDKMAKNLKWYYELRKTIKPTRLDLYIPLYNKCTTVDSNYMLEKALGLKTLFNNKTIHLKGAIENDVEVALSAGVQTTCLSFTFKGGPAKDGLPKDCKKIFKADYPFVFMVFGYGRAYFAGVFRRAIT